MSRVLSFLRAGAPSVLLSPAATTQLVDRFGFRPYRPVPGSDPATDGWPVGVSVDSSVVTHRLSDELIELRDAVGAVQWPAPVERTWRVIARNPTQRWINFVGVEGEVDESTFLDAVRAGRVVAAFICPAPSTAQVR